MILIFGSKSGLRDDFLQYDTKTIILCHFLAKRLLEIAFHGNTYDSRWSKTTWKGVLYVKNKSHKILASYTWQFLCCIKKTAEGQICPPPPPPQYKIGLKIKTAAIFD